MFQALCREINFSSHTLFLGFNMIFEKGVTHFSDYLDYVSDWLSALEIET